MSAVDSAGDEDSGEEEFTKNRFKIAPSLLEKLQDIPEAVEYIKLLERQIKKQRRKLKRIKAKLKVANECVDAEVQTEDVYSNGETANKRSEPKSIAEEITEAAEQATQNTGFVYDESSGLYYDSNTGFYYNAEYGLYYDATTGTYMSYKQETNTYEFHSQVHPTPAQNTTASEIVSLPTKEIGKRKTKNVDKIKAPKCERMEVDPSTPSDTEEGECSRSSTSDCDCDCDYSDESNSDTSDITRQWPPCMRIIVEQSKAPKIKIGSLHILTFEGGTLGREGSHSVLLPDINISKCHLRFTFDKEANHFLVTDLGSRNGTVLNGKRMSSSKQESEALEVAHGSRIQMGSVVLLCHVHEGSKTCGHCEPGLVQISEDKTESSSKISKTESHKDQLKKLRKKFGVGSFEDGSSKLASGYTDRAQKRRDTVGSQNPHEKTEVSSLEESIPSQNKGFKMLAKMGWKEGQSLGKEGQGMLEPVKLVSNAGTSGMGISETPLPEVKPCDKAKQVIWKKTQERFKKLPNTVTFDDSDE